MATISIYSARTGRLRRIVIDDRLSAERMLPIHPPRVGELAHVGNVSQVELNVITGLDQTDDRYVAVDVAGIVQSFLVCDPDCGDSSPLGTLVSQAVAGRNWRQSRNGLTFERSPEDIENEIAVLERQSARLDSQDFRDSEQAIIDAGDPNGDDPLNSGQITAAIAQLQAKIPPLEAELATRNRDRP